MDHFFIRIFLIDEYGNVIGLQKFHQFAIIPKNYSLYENENFTSGKKFKFKQKKSADEKF